MTVSPSHLSPAMLRLQVEVEIPNTRVSRPGSGRPGSAVGDHQVVLDARDDLADPVAADRHSKIGLGVVAEVVTTPQVATWPQRPPPVDVVRARSDHTGLVPAFPAGDIRFLI